MKRCRYRPSLHTEITDPVDRLKAIAEGEFGG